MKNHLFLKGVLFGIVLSSIFVFFFKPYKKEEIINDAMQNYGLPPIDISSVTYAYHNNVFGADWYGFKAAAKNSDAAEWRKEVEKLYNQKQLLDDVEIEWISSPGDPLDIEMKLSDMNK